jgi:hypothetical protein
MKLITNLLAGMLVCCVACNEASKTESETGTTVSKDTATRVDDSHISTTPIPLDGCYLMVANKDSANLRLNVVDSMVSGHLSYHLAEKDHNDGSLKGVVRDGLVITYYTFRSEGTMSVRQVVFKMEGTALTEGYGDIDASGDTVKFKNISELKYMNDRPFLKKPCVE